MDRRQFFRRFGGTLGAILFSELFPGLTLYAEPMSGGQGTDHFFILLRTFGGMDVTLGLDPQILPQGFDADDLFLEYRPEEITQSGGLRLGPAARVLAPFAHDCLVINGIMMRRDAGHDVVNQYMMTGRGDGKAASLPIELALALSAGPFGVVISAPTYLAGKSMNLSATSDILQSSDEGNLIELVEEKLKLMPEELGTPLEEAEKRLVAGKSSALKLQEYLASFKKEGAKVEDQHVIAAAFASGAARQAQMEIRPPGTLDTHSNHEKNHLQSQTAVWEEVAELFKLFKRVPYKGGSLFDATTFMVMSEFARTPALNAAKGKDHNPFTNSCLLAGKGIHAGKVVGASRLINRKQTGLGMSDHIAWPYNYKEQKLAMGPEGASFLFPENVIQTVGRIFGSPAAFTPVASSVPVIPGVAKG